MPIVDAFTGDAFTVQSLTAAILKAPYKPSRLGQLGLFNEKGMSTTVAVVEEKSGTLTLIPATPRGGPGDTLGRERRTARTFQATHLQRESTILADEVQGVRAFGSENAAEGVQTVVNQRLATLRAMHEVTLEFHRVGALKGLILDADGLTTIYDLFTEFGIAQQTYAFDLADTTVNIRNACVATTRLIEDALGAAPISGFRAFCGDAFFDALVAHESVVESLAAQESIQLRTDLRKGFQYGGITWENYRGSVGGVAFFPTDEAYVFPEGTDIFQTWFAPADFMETVNTIGLPLYAKLGFDTEFNRWAKVHSQSNPLAICTQPRAVVKATLGAS